MSISYFVKLLEKKQYVAAELLLTEKLVDVNANFEGKSLIFWFSYYVRSVPDNFMLAYDLLETLIVNGADPTYGLNKNQTFKTQMDLFLRGTAILFTRSATLELSLLRFTPARRAVCKYVKELVSLPNLDQVLETCNTIKLEDIPNFVALNGGPKRCEADAPQLDTMFKVIGSIFSPSQEEKKEKKECEDNIEKDIELFINNFMGNLFPSFPKPTKTDSKEVKEEKRLGSWCANQRTNKKNVGSELDQDAVWTNNYKEVKKWYDEHDGQKPSSVSKDAEEKRLGSWCTNQRTNKKNVGSELDQDAVWINNYNEVKKWYDEHDRQKPSSVSKDAEEKRLGSWCTNQRTNKKNVGSELDQDAVWINNYNEVKKWYDEHDRQKPSSVSKDAEEKRLGSWCANQRTNKKNVGSELDQDAVWTNNYKEVKKWYDEHYGQKPFITSKDAEEKRLGSWCANQRTNKKEVKPEVKQEVKQEVTIEDDVVSEVIEANKDNDDVRIVVIQRGDKLEDILNNAISIHTNLHA
jgi:hypothetical protein